MKNIMIKLLLSVSLMLPLSTQAGVLTTVVDSLSATTTTSADVTIEVLQLFGALADDIGEMADRIIVMAGEIGLMADRIVATEEILAGLALDIAEIKVATTATTSTATTIYITAPLGTDLYFGATPEFVVSTLTSEFLVYVSGSSIMNTNTISVLVHNTAELATLWPKLADLAIDNKISIAVKTIENNTISSLSNVITYTIY